MEVHALIWPVKLCSFESGQQDCISTMNALCCDACIYATCLPCAGVVTYVREELSPLNAKANWLGDFDDPLLEDFCNEGRLVETDHGSFILINVYAPNAGELEQGRPRLGFKLSFLNALKRKCELCDVRMLLSRG